MIGETRHFGAFQPLEPRIFRGIDHNNRRFAMFGHHLSLVAGSLHYGAEAVLCILTLT